jgi:carboxypeptidase family protein
MRARDLIPLTGLVALAVLVVLAARDAPPLTADFGEPPEKADLPRPRLDLGTAKLEGTLLGRDGTPVEGAGLFVVRAGRPIWTFSDGAGRFVLAEVDPGPIEVAIHAPGHQAALLTTEAGAGVVILRLPHALPDPGLLPDPTPQDLTGRIEAPHADLSGFEVALIPRAAITEPGTGVPRRTTCDRDGRFEFPGLTPAEYEVLLLPPWASGGGWPDLLTPLTSRALRFSHPPAAALVLHLATGDIAGSVFEADGGALEGALVMAIPAPESADTQDPRRFPPTRSGTDGAFRLEFLPPGKYRVLLSAGGEQREIEVRVTPGAAVDPGF